jgi:acid phosphatase family membrane protein YuiD
MYNSSICHEALHSAGFHNTGYEIIASAFLAAIIAQSTKVLTYIMQHRSINFKIFTTTGGMPSSHSAFVIGMATSTGLIDGFLSTTFALALGFALVVMYDAAGLRRAAGKMAATLNKIVDHVYDVPASERLKELLGHTPVEVFIGAILGIAVGIFVHRYM